jgi:hypothetical protein
MSLRSLKKLLIACSLFACTSAFAAPFTFNVGGVQSIGELGDPENQVYEINVGANATITSVSYTVNLTTIGFSYLSEFALAFTNGAFTDGVLLNPGIGDDGPGTGTYSELIDLVAEGLSFSVDADGILRLEFYEDFDDDAGADGIWNFGTITFNTDADVPTVPGTDVPEPATGMLMGAGLALMGYTARRRRNGANAA